MLIENQTVQMTWSTNNKKKYVQKGYKFTNFGDVFNIKVEDLSNGSHAKVKLKCDYCGEIIIVEWRDYIRYKGVNTFVQLGISSTSLAPY